MCPFPLFFHIFPFSLFSLFIFFPPNDIDIFSLGGGGERGRIFLYIHPWVPLEIKAGNQKQLMPWSVKCFIASIFLQQLNASPLHCLNVLPLLTFSCFIAFQISSLALMFKKKEILMQ
jgi:hypothetical protein